MDLVLHRCSGSDHRGSDHCGSDQLLIWYCTDVLDLITVDLITVDLISCGAAHMYWIWYCTGVLHVHMVALFPSFMRAGRDFSAYRAISPVQDVWKFTLVAFYRINVGSRMWCPSSFYRLPG